MDTDNARPNRGAIAVAVIVVVVVFALVLTLGEDEEPSPDTTAQRTWPVETTTPDFASFTDVREKKRAFFEYLLPMIRNANEATLAERAFIGQFAGGNAPDDADQARLTVLAEKYRGKISSPPTQSEIDDLLTRVDAVPASLILAQAANESAWGTSRFARKGNNYFGIWCFVPGCGMTPRYRDEGLTHEVKSFASVQDAVHYYLQTINSNPAYKELRRIRRLHRQQEENPTGVMLAEGLSRYSERGEEYVAEVQSMIRYNELQQYTRDLFGPPPDIGETDVQAMADN